MMQVDKFQICYKKLFLSVIIHRNGAISLKSFYDTESMSGASFIKFHAVVSE